ncbi:MULTISPECIES: ABC transporter permease [unclassified Actinomyces]|uniref:ABC transporter permease n=1 Tax=unclassified Actinomyces TaxID=2609248 RepID=UPI002017D1D5|nr:MULTISPECIES: ABC transporter permease [unclassified Actinomyces]
MGSVFRYQVLAYLRDPVLLLWTLAFPVIMSLIFMGMFSSIHNSEAINPLRLGVVEDAAYEQVTGLDALIDSVSTASGERSDGEGLHLIDPVATSTEAQAEAAALNGDTVGYIVVQDGEPVLRLTAKGGSDASSIASSTILRAVMDSFAQGQAEGRAIETEATAAGDRVAAAASAGEQPDPEDLALLENVAASAGTLGQSRTWTTELVVSQVPGALDTPYYLSLLAFACGMGMNLSLLAARAVTVSSGALGARRTLAALPRWRVLAGILAAAWVCIFVCLVVAYAFMRWVVGVNFGPRFALGVVVIAVGALMACMGGAVLGTTKVSSGSVAGLTALLSLFTGLFGQATQELSRAVEDTVPVLARLNPLWQCTRTFHSLIYYDTLGPFVQGCLTMLAMAAVLGVVALLRLRRMSS